MPKDDFVVLRAKEQIRDRLLDLAKKRNQTLTAITDIALETFLDSNEFAFEDLLGEIAKISSLAPSLENIKIEMKDCPAPVCKQILNIIIDREVFLYEETFDSVYHRVEEIDKKNLDGIFMHLTIRSNEINKINDTLKKVSEILKGTKIKLGVGVRGNNHEKILLFVAYNKKEGENVKR